MLRRIYVCVHAWRRASERERMFAVADREYQRSERLLLNILPRPIADRLKREQGIIADGFGEVTVLFADIVNVTSYSSRVSPAEVVAMLDAIFSRFDRLAERHGLEKIKTIGDASMVVGGLPTSRPDHAEACAEMALDMLEEVRRHAEATGQELRVWIGLNSGPVVAGVIGTTKFTYDRWGDTVNTASRMESHGLSGGVQVTEATRGRLDDRYHVEERGAIDVTGKGPVTTFLLTGRREEATLAGAGASAG